MKNKNQILKLIFKRFPNHTDYVTELFNESESFKSLCEDYYDCRMLLDKSIIACNKKNDMRQEYQLLMAEIEEELLERIYT